MTSIDSRSRTTTTSAPQSTHDVKLKVSPLQEAQQDLWKAIQMLVKLQNQSPPLKSLSEGQPRSLSFTQERLWLLNQLEPESSAYNLPFAFRLEGRLQVEVLERTLQALLQRHPVLRTTFQSSNAGDFQLIGEPSQFSLSQMDLQSIAADKLESQLQEKMAETAQLPFDLNHELPLRATLFLISETTHVLLLTVHHIAFDGWSEGILWKELATFYNAFSKGEVVSLDLLPIQYTDFAVWQRAWLRGEFLEVLRRYWREQLTGKDLKLHLPIDKPYPTVPLRQSAFEVIHFFPELTAELKAFSRQEGVTLFVLLLSAFQVLLHQYTAQDSVFVCSPVANRNRKEIRGIIGYFVNLLVLQADCSNNPSFRSFLTQVRQTVTGAYAYQDLPVQQLMSQLDGTQVNFSQVMFVLQNTPQQALSLNELSVESLPIDNGMADFDLSMSLTDQENGLTGILKYNQDLFDHSTIAQLIRHFQQILQAGLSRPDSPVSELIQFTEAETESLAQGRQRAIAANTPRQEQVLQRPTFVAPRNNIERQLVEIWETLLEISPIGVNDNFFELGGESLVAFNLFAQIEARLGYKLPLATLLTAPTVEQLATILQQERWSPEWSSLVPLRSQGSKLPLFLVAPGAYTALHYLDLVNLLDPEQPVYGLQSRGLEENQSPHHTIEEMAAHYLHEMESLDFEGPYLLGGRCGLGATVAFEMAQQLRQRNKQVNLVAFIDPTWNAFRRFFETEPNRKSIRHYLNRLHYLWQEKFLKKVLASTINKAQVAAVENYSEVDHSPNQHDQRIQAITNVHKRAMLNYLPQVYQGRITLFQAEDRFEMAAYDRWQVLATEGLDRHSVTGKHQDMLVPPNIQILAQKLQSCLDHVNECSLPD
ncbi:MAG: hypothetical protein F6K42_10895 [Leptolyngbya sp. SIO1D8]|nr:hypothetical protein [Leptolyngbya sp. SIO1D8]